MKTRCMGFLAPRAAPLAGLCLFLAAFQPASAQAASGTSFKNFEVAYQPVGTKCPGAGSGCWNYAAEPQIRSDPAGNLFASSENGLGGGTDAWKSVNGGRAYTTLACPNCASASNNTGLAPGGGDTDVATATQKNAAGDYNVYVASLNLANVDVSTSADGGKTWALNPTSATVPVDDREWIAADGAAKVCISYHDISTWNIDVNCSYAAGAAGTFTQLGSAIDSAHAFLLQNNEIGNLAIDPQTHYVYQTLSGIANASEVVCSTQGTCGYHVVYMAVSTDGGRTFSDHVVYASPNPAVSYGHQFVNVSVDAAGNLYSVFSDNHDVYFSYSTDHGQSWSAPVRINSGSSATAIMPWSVAGAAGKVDVVWYGTSYYDGTNPPDNYPSSAAWYVYFAQNLAATAGGQFSQVKATPVIHYGGVCEGGISCTGNRDLYDDFGVAVDPADGGLASIVYSDDQYGSPSSYQPPQPGCTSSQSNTISCDHTNFATQTSGTGIG